MASAQEKKTSNVEIITSDIKELRNEIKELREHLDNKINEMTDKILARTMETVAIAPKPTPKKQAKTTTETTNEVAVPKPAPAKKTTSAMPYPAFYKKIKEGTFPEETCDAVVEKTLELLKAGTDKIAPYDPEEELRESDPEYEKAEKKTKQFKLITHLMGASNKTKYSKIYGEVRNEFNAKKEGDKLKVEPHD